jgi:hypothetical protein
MTHAEAQDGPQPTLAANGPKNPSVRRVAPTCASAVCWAMLREQRRVDLTRSRHVTREPAQTVVATADSPQPRVQRCAGVGRAAVIVHAAFGDRCPKFVLHTERKKEDDPSWQARREIATRPPNLSFAPRYRLARDFARPPARAPACAAAQSTPRRRRRCERQADLACQVGRA